MKQILNLYKDRYETPKERLERFVLHHPEYAEVSVSYAGRLDPMAEGVLPIVAGEGILRKDAVLALSKEYELTILFGFATDSIDVLGKLTDAISPLDVSTMVSFADMLAVVPQLIGTWEQEYPAYSSKTVEGIPLHAHARAGTLPDAMPTKSITIESVELLEWGSVSIVEIAEEIKAAVEHVHGDFRQEEIALTWGNTLRQYSADSAFPIVHLRVRASSGAYMRSLAQFVGQSLDVPTLAFHIVRTRVGDFTIEEALRD